MGAAVVAAIAAKQQRELTDAFESREATSAATALSLAMLGLDRNRMFRSFEQRGVIKTTGDDRYWLDRQALADWREDMRRVGVRIVLALLALSVILSAIVIIQAQRG